MIDVSYAHPSKVILHPHATSILNIPTLSPFCSTPPPTLSTSAPPMLTGIRSTTQRAASPWGGPSGHLADPTPRTGCEPNFCIDVSSEHTPINFPSRKDSFNLENDPTNTVAAADDFDHLPQTTRSQQQLAFGSKNGSNVVEFRFSPQCWGTGARQRLNCRFIIQTEMDDFLLLFRQVRLQFQAVGQGVHQGHTPSTPQWVATPILAFCAPS